jgi:hypothetical protein
MSGETPQIPALHIAAAHAGRLVAGASVTTMSPLTGTSTSTQPSATTLQSASRASP